MKRVRFLAWIIGGSCIATIILGALLLIPSKAWSVFVAVVVICLSLVLGMLFLNPISFWTLIAGICVIVFPAWYVGSVLIAFGVI